MLSASFKKLLLGVALVQALSIRAPETKVTLRIALAQPDFPGLEKALYAAATPGSEKYGQYLSKYQVNEYVSPSQESISVVSDWLTSNGLALSTPASASGWLSVDATIEQASQLLSVDLSKEKRNSGARFGKRSYTIPADVEKHITAIHPAISGPSSTPKSSHSPPRDQLNPHTNTTTPTNSAAASLETTPASCFRDNNNYPWTEEEGRRPWSIGCRFDLHEIPYRPLGEPAKGTGIWLSGFDNQFVLKNRTRKHLAEWRPDISGREMFDLVSITGGLNSQLPHDWIGHSYQTYFSMSLIMTTAPNTPVTLMAVGTDESSDPMVWLIDQANHLLEMEEPPQVLVHTGFMLTENSIDPDLARSLCASYGQLAARGVTLLFATQEIGVGDAWPNDECDKFDLTFPASCPYVTAIGGSYAISGPEQGTRNSGGFSSLFTRPVYQDAAVTAHLDAHDYSAHEGMYNPAGRATPDITAQYLLSEANTEDAYFGENAHFAAALVGGVAGLLNEELLEAGKPALGFLNPLLYANPEAFRDIQAGRTYGCYTDGFDASEGWDPMTGLGSVAHSRLRAAVGL